jgi:hypothetical protein
LAVPLFDPGIWAHRLIAVLEVLASLAVVALNLGATVKVQIRLVAVSRLVRVGETGVEWSGFEFNSSRHFGCKVSCAWRLLKRMKKKGKFKKDA